MAKIVIENLSVEFKIYGQRSRSLKNIFLNQATGGIIECDSDTVTVRAVSDFSLTINEGDRIGLTGHNGAGKSTLLRVLAGIYRPSKGRISIEGSVGTLIDMSAGMDQEATGVENIYLRSYVLGIKRQDIPGVVEDVREFTGLGNFLDLPIKTYSSGMVSRLNFAISTSISPDILIIDEGISAGDQEFRERAMARLNAFKGRAKILVMANHSRKSLEPYCNDIITLKAGKIVDTS